MKSTIVCRARLATLWFSQVARTIADNALRVFVLLKIAESGPPAGAYAWHLVAALLGLPAVLLAPFNGAISNSLPKRWVLTWAAAYCCVVVAGFSWLGWWVAGWALLAVGAAVYGPTRYAILPAAAVDCRLPLTRVNGWIEMGAVTAIIAGFVLGIDLIGVVWLGIPAAVTVAILLNFLAGVTALPAAFPSDLRRPEKAGQAIAGFFRDTARIWGDREARGALFALGCLRAIVTGSTGALIAVMLRDETAPMMERIEALLPVLTWVVLGGAAGSVLAGAQRHPRRALGLVPLGASGFVISLVLAAGYAREALPEPMWALGFALGAMGGLINVPLAAAYQMFLPADARGNGMAVRNMFDYLMMAGMSALLFGLAKGLGFDGTAQLWLVAWLGAAGVVVAWIALHRETVEQLLEIAIWPLYRITGHGPGLDAFPQRGPLLVVANHAAWFDPIWLAKVLPRSLRPMMTSTFYDMPQLRWLMKYVARAIRVQYSTFRREAPELQQAIAALDQGECVVLFPEGSLRKNEERPLRHFGQGVWHLLSQRPQTPVVVCWIEGNWGSFFSYWKGPPTKNKGMDFWRHIDIAVGQAHQMDGDTLANLKTTRVHLEELCREMRGVLGLPVPPPDKGPEAEMETS